MKIKVSKAILVEGKYDKIKLESFIDGLIITTDGFKIFKDKEKKSLIKTLCDTVGLIIITDSDVAGFRIRNHIKSITKNSSNITNIYIPQIKGKEKRKTNYSKEGTLGVEGIDINVLKDIFEKQNISTSLNEKNSKLIKKIDLYNHGFCGHDNSSKIRQELLSKLNLPSYISTNSLLDVINVLISYDEFLKISKEINSK